MFYDLYIPFPLTLPTSIAAGSSKKQKGKTAPAEKPFTSNSCWEGIGLAEREEFSKSIGMAGHRECQSSTDRTWR